MNKSIKNKSLPKKEGGGKILQFKITLNDSRPSIWRRIQVPSEYTFFELHVAIQDAMGWSDSHLHSFNIAQKGTTVPIMIQYPNPESDSELDNDSLDERDESVTNYFGKTIKQCVYEYDFGDSWDHTVLLEKEISPELGVKYPRCTAGKNACPPDDCGGMGGYEHLKKVLKNPKHPDHDDMVDWLCIDNASDFDPAEFSPREVVFQNPKVVLRNYKRGFGV